LVQIILVDKRLARARTITVSRHHALVAALLLLFSFLLMSGLFSWLTVRLASEFRVPLVSDVISFVTRDQVERQEQYMRDSVSAMARRLGEVQANVLRLDALGERVARAAGIKPEEFRFKDLPGRGGAPASAAISGEDLEAELQRLARGVDQRSDYLAVVEAELRAQQARKTLLPNSQPLADGFIGSGFGWRTDPFTGEMTRHDGIDFAAPVGTPIHAAAGGVVVVAEHHPVWGKVVEVDHGNRLMTRYAHASKLVVQTGDIVKPGQKVAEVGSTGRSTGPHLHFEVHRDGVAQNPGKFLLARDAPIRSVAPAAKVDLQGLAAAANARN
jgi:murein DD-endopeptidase MepM/ murein hydrolase activator NlpD